MGRSVLHGAQVERVQGVQRRIIRATGATFEVGVHGAIKAEVHEGDEVWTAEGRRD
ncbi:MAG: hypothetical protein R6U63_04470 [Longimicrobiales bacterium]